MVDPGSRPAEAVGLRIDAVEVLPTDLRSVLLRVAGAWEDEPPDDLRAPVLVLRAAGREHRLAALERTSGAAVRAAPEARPFRAAFSVPETLAPQLEEPVELDLGALTVRLPAPARAGEDGPDAAGGTVVDPAVLAERRARRAELDEQASLRRVGEAEGAVARLEGELGKLELRLAAATDERGELEARLAEREDELRAEREGAADSADLRERLDAADQRARRLDGELEIARQRADEVQRAASATTDRAVDAARTAVERHRELDERDRELQARADAVARAERETAAAHEALVRAMARARAMRLELEALRGDVGGAETASPGAPSPRRAEDAAVHERLERSLAELGEELRGAREAAATEAREREAERERTRTAEARATEIAQRLAEAERRLAAPPPPPPPTGRAVRRSARPASPWLPSALRTLARSDPAAGARLALELLPGQALAVPTALAYDVEVPGLGRHRVRLSRGGGELAAPVGGLAGRRTTAFRVAATPAGLVELVLAGGAVQPVGVHVLGTLRRRRALRRLPAVPLRLVALAAAGVLPDPGLLYRALAETIDPGWTRGHRFAVELEVAGPRGGTWRLTAADGARLAVARSASGAGASADAGVRISQTGLAHLLDGEPPPRGEKAAIRGDVAAVGLIGQWTDRARNVRV